MENYILQVTPAMVQNTHASIVVITVTIILFAIFLKNGQLAKVSYTFLS